MMAASGTPTSPKHAVQSCFARDPMTLMTSRFRDGHWTTPETLPFSGTYRDLDTAFSPDGSRRVRQWQFLKATARLMH
jgi:hypothetical protein